MKTISAFLLVFSFIVSACTFNMTVLTPPPVQPTPSSTQSAATLIASPIATISATAELPSPTPSGPLFYSAVFTADPSISRDGNIFAVGVKQVFVDWNYLNMRAGMKIRREWYLNGQLWLTREEAWDFAKYGVNGTTQHEVSTYDFDHGLPTGIYELRMYIDNVLQPIGASINGQPDTKATFDIRSSTEAQAGAASPDFQWSVEIFGEQRIVLEDKTGNPKEVFTAREVPYIVWFNDSKHFLFVDRDHSNQKSGTTIGIRDDLWIVDVPSGATHLLYKSDTSFAGIGGPSPSPYGGYIASLEGSGFGDACSVDTRLIFFKLSSDFSSAKVIKQQDFSGLPKFTNGMIYPSQQVLVWYKDSAYLATMDGTCDADKSKLGPYEFNLADRTANKVISATQQPIPGDLGVGMIHGKVTNASTGAPISNASVICEQHSYTSATPCSGTVLTNANGEYAFNNIFFHDTDTIKITVQAAGYQTQEISKTSFTTNDLPLDIALSSTQ